MWDGVRLVALVASKEEGEICELTRCHVRMQQDNSTRHQPHALLRLSSLLNYKTNQPLVFINRSVAVRQSNRKWIKTT